MVWVPLAQVEPSDDVLHDAGTEESWSEHHYFFFSDADTGLAGGCRVAWRLEDGVAKGFVFCFADGGACLWQQDGGDDRLSAGPLEFQGTRLGQWRIRFDDNVLRLSDPLALSGLSETGGDTPSIRLSFDLRFSPMSPAMSAHPGPDAAELVRRIAPSRFEQAGRYTGEACVDGRRIEVSGFGSRDHSWGARATEGLRDWKWCSLPLRDGLCGGAGHVVLDEGEITSGWLVDGEGLVPVDSSSIVYEFDGSGLVPKSATVTLEAGGRRREFVGTVVTPLGLRVTEHGRSVLAVECLARYVADDGTAGYGVVEYVRAI